MELLFPRHRLGPNTPVQSLYSGVGSRGPVTSIVRAHADGNHLERMSLEGVATPVPGRGEGGNAAVIILGGMETTLDEVRDMLAARRERKFVAQKKPGEIVRMCRELLERRNDALRYFKKNPSEAPKPRPRVRLLLPRGFRMVPTREPGLEVRVRV